MRSLWTAIAAASLLWSSAGLAQDEGEDGPKGRPDQTDLRSGHLLMYAGGGLWIHDNLPDQPQLGNILLGPTAQVRVGFGIGRLAVLGLDGGFNHATGDCPNCGVYSVSGGAFIAAHVSQGFAMDPWVSYGAGIRYNAFQLVAGDKTELSVDVAKLALGADFYPVPSFGFGPYLGLTLGVRRFDEPASYAIFQTGLRVAFDPFRRGTQLSPVIASR